MVVGVGRIFSRDFYLNDESIKITDGQSKLFLSQNGTISAVHRTDPNWEAQTSDLPGVYRQIHRLIGNIPNPVASQIWKAEIHDEKARGYMLLRSCISHINMRFAVQNDNNRFKILIYKIINFFRSLFCCSKLDTGEYELFDFSVLDKFAKNEALGITGHDRQEARHRLTILSENPPAELTSDNLQRLERGLLEEIPLAADYSLRYKDLNRQFYIRYKNGPYTGKEKYGIVVDKRDGQAVRYEMGKANFSYRDENGISLSGQRGGLDEFPLELKEYLFYPDPDGKPIAFQIEPNRQ